jgi:hypothetical protein
LWHVLLPPTHIAQQVRHGEEATDGQWFNSDVQRRKASISQPGRSLDVMTPALWRTHTLSRCPRFRAWHDSARDQETLNLLAYRSGTMDVAAMHSSCRRRRVAKMVVTLWHAGSSETGRVLLFSRLLHLQHFPGLTGSKHRRQYVSSPLLHLNPLLSSRAPVENFSPRART